MSTSDSCNVCRREGAGGGPCPHCTDLNYAIPTFPDQHEFQFFGHDDMLTWLFNDPRLGEPPPPPPPPPLPLPSDYMESFCEPFLPGHAPTFDVPLWVAESGPGTSEGIGAGHAAASNDTIMSFSGSTFTDALSGDAKDVGDTMTSNQGDASMGREAKVMRYKEKKKKRRYDKHIRYALRKAYAEMRPRINGRFAKVPEMSPPIPEPLPLPLPPPPPPYDPNRPDLGWFPF